MRKFCNILSFVILLGIVIVTCIDVFGRYLLGHALSGTTELTEIGVAILVFMVFPFVCYDEEHVQADILYRFYPKKLIRFQNWSVDVLYCFGLFFVGISLYGFAIKSYKRSEVSEFLEIPLWIVPAFISLICFITVLLLLYKFLNSFKKKNSVESIEKIL